MRVLTSSDDLLLHDSAVSSGTFYHIQGTDQNLDLYLPNPAYWQLLDHESQANAVPNPEMAQEKPIRIKAELKQEF